MAVKNKDDGGAAFGEFKQVGDCSIKTGGISVRDYFAAKAMSAIVTSQLGSCGEVPHEQVPGFFAISANYAYIAADAMLAERAK